MTGSRQVGVAGRLQTFVRAHLAGQVSWPTTPEQVALVQRWITHGRKL